MFGLSAAAVVGITGAAVSAVGMAASAANSNTQGGASSNAAREQTNQSKAKQEELNSQSELARAIQKVNNDRIMRAADKTYTAAATNLTRNRAAAQTNNVMAQLAQAEAAGAYAANVASKGIGGGSVEVIENTMALRDDLKNRLTKNAQSQADYDAVQTLAGIIPAGWQQQDMTVLSGNQSAAAAQGPDALSPQPPDLVEDAAVHRHRRRQTGAHPGLAVRPHVRRDRDLDRCGVRADLDADAGTALHYATSSSQPSSTSTGVARPNSVTRTSIRCSRTVRNTLASKPSKG